MYWLTSEPLHEHRFIPSYMPQSFSKLDKQKASMPKGCLPRNPFMRRFIFVCTPCFLLALAIGASGQTLKHRPEKPEAPAPAEPKPVPSIALQVAPGTPLKVALDKEVRIRRVGQPIGGTTTEPIYSFDKLLVPAGSRVTGKIAEIDDVSKKMRTLSAMNADFSPGRKVRVDFDQ